MDDCTLEIHDCAEVGDVASTNLVAKYILSAQTGVFSFDFDEVMFLKGLVVVATLGVAGPLNLNVEWE